MDPAGGITRNQGLSIVTDGHLDWDGCCNLERPQLSAGDIPEASVAVATAGEQVAIRSESRPQHTIGQFAKHTAGSLGRMRIAVGDAGEPGFGVPPDQPAIFTARRQYLAVAAP